MSNNQSKKDGWGAIIRAKCGELNINRADLVRDTGLARPTIDKIWNGDEGVLLENVLMVSLLIGVSVMKEGM